MHPNIGKLLAIMEMRQYATYSGRYDDDASKVPASWAETIARIRVINGRRYREEED